MSTYSIQRPSFFEGQYLGAEDFEILIDYFRTQDARQILGHHSWGIAMGLELVEEQAPDGTLDVFVQPGLAFDGYGRLIVVLNREKLDSSQFSDSGEIPVWIRHDEAKSQGLRKGFEVCNSTDDYARVNENFSIEFGYKESVLERNSGIVLNGADLIDPREALHAVDDQAALVCDGSIPHQEMSEQDEGRLFIHWNRSRI